MFLCAEDSNSALDGALDVLMGRDSLLGMGVGLQNFCLAILSLYYIIAWQAQPVCAATDCMSNVVSRCSGFLFCKVGKPAALAVAGSLVVLQVNRMKCFCCAFAIMSLLSVHFSNTHTHTHLTALCRGYPGKLVPER